MRIKILSFVAASLLATGAWAAASSNSGVSGSAGFQVGALTVTSNTSSTALSFTVPLSAGGSVTIAIGSPAASLSQIGITLGAGNGYGYYVITDGKSTITVYVDENGEVASIENGDTAPTG